MFLPSLFAKRYVVEEEEEILFCVDGEFSNCAETYCFLIFSR